MLTKQPITRKMNAPAEKAWDAISKIDRLDVWFSFIATCRIEGSGVGTRRYMTISNEGGEIEDEILEINHGARKFVYRRLISPFPVTSYIGTVEVFTSYDGNAVVVWTIDFESKPEDSAAVCEIVKEAIGGGLEGMEKDLTS